MSTLSPCFPFFPPAGGKNGKHLDNDYNESNIVVGVVPVLPVFSPAGGKNGTHLDNDYNESNIVVGVVPVLPIFPSGWEVKTGST